MVHIHNGLLLSREKEQIWFSSSEKNEPAACCCEPAVWSKSEKENQMSFINAYIWNLEKWYWTICRVGIEMHT